MVGIFFYVQIIFWQNFHPLLSLQIVFGPKLGSGEFSNVYEVQSFRLHKDFSDTQVVGEEELDKRSHMKTYEKYRETKNARYAVKHIMEEYHLQNDSTSYMLAARYVVYIVLRYFSGW